jgi:aspartyl-tRNA(Asn)/glutamyl-tRNA(Gln) amidotransferase subunit A
MATLLGGFARWTRPINYLGLPALSVPAGFAGGLPVGAQLIGPMFSEPLLFAVGRLYQAEIGFSAWRPALAG